MNTMVVSWLEKGGQWSSGMGACVVCKTCYVTTEAKMPDDVASSRVSELCTHAR